MENVIKKQWYKIWRLKIEKNVRRRQTKNTKELMTSIQNPLVIN